MSVKSMTGFARIRRSTELGEATFTLRSVNHRGLDLHFNLPSVLDPFEHAMRAALKKHVARGHVELRVAIEKRKSTQAPSVNRELVESYLAAFRELALEHSLTGEPDLNAALQLPGALSEAASAEPDEAVEAEMVEGVTAACELLNAFREREGAELVAELLTRQRAILAAASQLEGLRERAVEAVAARLSERAAEMAVKLDPQRLAQEVALLADRSDIAEEVTRLGIHARQLEQLLSGSGEIGKKTDFLLQEMNRETNTMLSKTQNAGDAGIAITNIALEIKSQIEKIREQSLNLE